MKSYFFEILLIILVIQVLQVNLSRGDVVAVSKSSPYQDLADVDMMDSDCLPEKNDWYELASFSVNLKNYLPDPLVTRNAPGLISADVPTLEKLLKYANELAVAIEGNWKRWSIQKKYRYEYANRLTWYAILDVQDKIKTPKLTEKVVQTWDHNLKQNPISRISQLSALEVYLRRHSDDTIFYNENMWQIFDNAADDAYLGTIIWISIYRTDAYSMEKLEKKMQSKPAFLYLLRQTVEMIKNKDYAKMAQKIPVLERAFVSDVESGGFPNRPFPRDFVAGFKKDILKLVPDFFAPEPVKEPWEDRLNDLADYQQTLFRAAQIVFDKLKTADLPAEKKSAYEKAYMTVWTYIFMTHKFNNSNIKKSEIFYFWNQMQEKSPWAYQLQKQALLKYFSTHPETRTGLQYLPLLK